MNTQYANNYQSNNFVINLELLPPFVQQELLDYYLFLISKYVPTNEKTSKKEQFFQSVKTHRYKLPKEYKFDRDIANER